MAVQTEKIHFKRSKLQAIRYITQPYKYKLLNHYQSSQLIIKKFNYIEMILLRWLTLLEQEIYQSHVAYQYQLGHTRALASILILVSVKWGTSFRQSLFDTAVKSWSAFSWVSTCDSINCTMLPCPHEKAHYPFNCESLLAALRFLASIEEEGHDVFWIRTNSFD